MVRAVWLGITADVARGLAYLHANSIGHYLLHPRNVLFDAEMHAKLADYGRTGAVVRHILSAQAEGDGAGAH